MKIVIDARMLHWTGIGRYTKALLDELQQIDGVNSYVVLVRRADWDIWEPSAANFTKVESNANPYSLNEQWQLFWQLRALKADVVHFTAPNTPLLYQGRRVVTIHDLTLLDFNTSHGWGLARWIRGLKQIPFRMVMANDGRLATAIITPTAYVGDQIVKRLKTKPAKVHTTLLATDPQLAAPAPLERLGELGTYIFYVGNMYPYKNIGSTIKALHELRDTYADLNLVIAGTRDLHVAELERLAKELGLEARVKFAGYVSDGELISLYRGAAVYVNPSLSEGFGLQGLEAMAQGVPVVAARATCLPEVYGEAAQYFDPKNPVEQALVLGRVLGDATVAAQLRSAGVERLRTFSWRRMAEQTAATYAEVAAAPVHSFKKRPAGL
jgi:glycosyltransferase involved in cell wall biosynthesis